MKHFWFTLFSMAWLLLTACNTAHPPHVMVDSDVIPVGSRVNFWVNHDDEGWKESNIHIAYLPRPMTGAEARRWAEGAGTRDGGMLWTHYYVLVTPPGADGRVWRSNVHARGATWDPGSKRL
ncbi:hypothetical protein [Brevifollis gellanilyticus]|nr:hypothetical protein [Brevifollis gellanilyticus]